MFSVSNKTKYGFMEHYKMKFMGEICMKMYESTNSFKTVFFEKEPKRITIEKGTLWFVVRKDECNGSTVLSDNKIELKVSNDLLKTNFDRWG